MHLETNAMDCETKEHPVHLVVNENKWCSVKAAFTLHISRFINNPFYEIRAHLDVKYQMGNSSVYIISYSVWLQINYIRHHSLDSAILMCVCECVRSSQVIIELSRRRSEDKYSVLPIFKLRHGYSISSWK